MFTNLTLSSTTFSVEVSGTLPAAYPNNALATLYFVNPDPTASPGFAVSDFAGAETRSFLGSGQDALCLTGGSAWGDYAMASFSQPLAPGEALSGTLSGTWAGGAVLDVSGVSALNVFWGSDESQGVTAAAITGGVPVGSQVPVNVVPEAKAEMLAALGCTAFWLPRRRQRARHMAE